MSENVIVFLSARVKAAPLRMLSSSPTVHLIHGEHCVLRIKRSEPPPECSQSHDNLLSCRSRLHLRSLFFGLFR